MIVLAGTGSVEGYIPAARVTGTYSLYIETPGLIHGTLLTQGQELNFLSR